MDDSKTVGNQQATLIAWVAGLMEGEGSFILTHHPYKGRRNIRASVFLTNTDTDIIDAFIAFLKMIGINGWIRTFDRRKTKRRVCYQIIVNKMAERLKLVEVLIPYMKSATKKAQAVIVRDFTKLRVAENAKPKIRDSYGRLIDGGHAIQTEKDWHFYQRYKAIRESSEIVSRTPKRFGEDVIQATAVERPLLPKDSV